MKRFVILSCLAMLSFTLILGCETTEQAASPPPAPVSREISQAMPPFEQEDAIILDDTVAGLKIADMVDQKVKKAEKLIVVSMEDIENKTQSNFNYLVEDHLISNLVSDGYHVLERDENLIIRAVPEQDSAYQRSLLGQLPAPPSVVLMDGIEREGLEYVFKNDMPKDEKVNLPDLITFYNQLKSDYQALEPMFNHMESADVIVSYRLLEMGIRTQVNKRQEPATAEMKAKGIYADTPWTWNVNRECLARLFVRVMDSKSGEIRAAGLLQNMQSDKTVSLTQFKDEDDSTFNTRANAYVAALEKYHYSWFEQQLPNKNGNAEDKEQKK